MREHQLLSPSRQILNKPEIPHEGRIVADAPNQMWGTDATATFTPCDGLVTIFAAIDHCTAECIGIHVVKKADRFEALEPRADPFLVKGTVVGKSWNRGQVLLALAGVRPQGNLPPKIVAARTVERGRFVRGKVVRRLLDAVAGGYALRATASGQAFYRVT